MYSRKRKFSKATPKRNYKKPKPLTFASKVTKVLKRKEEKKYVSGEQYNSVQFFSGTGQVVSPTGIAGMSMGAAWYQRIGQSITPQKFSGFFSFYWAVNTGIAAPYPNNNVQSGVTARLVIIQMKDCPNDQITAYNEAYQGFDETGSSITTPLGIVAAPLNYQNTSRFKVLFEKTLVIMPSVHTNNTTDPTTYSTPIPSHYMIPFSIPAKKLRKIVWAKDGGTNLPTAGGIQFLLVSTYDWAAATNFPPNCSIEWCLKYTDL